MKKKTLDEWEKDEAKREKRSRFADWLGAPFTEPAPTRIGLVEAGVMALIGAILCVIGLFCGEQDRGGNNEA